MKYRPILLLLVIGIIGCNQFSQNRNEDSIKAEKNNIVASDTVGEEASLRRAQEKVQALGVPTPDQVDSLKTIGYNLFEAGKYQSAIDTLKLFSKKANWLANLISKGLEPYYSGPYDDREDLPYTKIVELSEFEAQSNELKKERNEAFIMIAEASIKIGKVDQATAYYFSALDLINPKSIEMWDRARTGLYDLLKVEN